MASLKEVKARIGSVNTTLKITSAMKMVSSAKLKKAQYAIEAISPYQDRLNAILNNFLATETDFQSAFSEVRAVSKVAIVALSSNSSLCGAFNSNVAKQLNATIREQKAAGAAITLYPIGKKVREAAEKTGEEIVDVDTDLADHPSFDRMKAVTDELMQKFLDKEIDKVIVIYHHLKNTAVQKLQTEVFLPITFDKSNDTKSSASSVDYVVEPSKAEILESLLPKALRTKLYACLLDSNASEHGARVVAMQVATDNGNELLAELNVLYNKTRQQAITNELLDIVGGAAALSK